MRRRARRRCPRDEPLSRNPIAPSELYRHSRRRVPREGGEQMGQVNWWVMDIIGPAILLIVLIWLVMRRRSTGKTGRTEQATRDLYAEEEQRRREGTDDL